MRYPAWRSRTFLTWLLCFILMLIVPLTFFSVYFSHSQKLLERKLHENNQAAISQVGSVFDAWFSAVNEIENRVYISQDIQKINNLSLPYDAEAYYKLHEYSKNLTLFTHQGVIDSVFVYYAPMECLLDGSRVYTAWNQLESAVRDRLHADPDWFFSLMASYQDNQFYCVDHQSILAVKSLDNRKIPARTVIIKMDMAPASVLLKSIEDSCGGNAFVLFENGGVFSPEAAPDHIPSYSSLLDDQDHGPLRIGGNLVTYANSQLPGIRYLISVPESAFLKDLNSSRQVYYISLAGILVLGILLSLLLARHNYRPLMELKRLANVPVSGRQDDFKQLNQRLTQLQNDSTRMQSSPVRLSQIADDRMLHLLITGGYLDEDIRQHLDRLRQTFNGAAYVCMLVDAVDYEDRTDLKIQALLDMKQRLLRVIGGGPDNVIRNGVACIEGYRLCIVLCFSSQQNMEDAQTAVRDIADQAHRRLTEESPAEHFRFYIGDACRTMDDIARSYEHAVACMEYCDYMSQSPPNVVMYNPAMFTASFAWNNYNAFDVERQFMKAMTDGDYAHGQKLLHDLISYYDYVDGTSIYVLRCRMFGLVNMMLNLFSEIAPDVDSSFYEDNHIQEKLLTAANMVDLKHVILRLFDQLIGLQDARPDAVLKAETIENYVAHHYYEETLSVQQIADAFHVSVPFLSRLFKKETNSGLLDYINRYRIDKFKQIMLLDPDMTIAAGAQKVGYNSSQTLIRVFKRYEDMTPGQWRASLS